MTRRKLLGAGIAGISLAGLCCFTPILAVLFGSAAISAAAGWLDYALFPTLGVFTGITAYAVLQRRKPPSYEGKRAR